MAQAPAGDWRPVIDERQQAFEGWFSTWNRRLVLCLGAVALMGVVLPGSWGTALSVAAVAAVIAAPVVRVLALTLLWRRQRDWRFVIAGASLVMMMLVGVVAAALRGS
jgi:Na+/proline symporter